MANKFRYIAPGDKIQVLNDTGSAWTAGQSVNKNLIVGIVERDTPNGEWGTWCVNAGPIFEGPLAANANVNYAIGEAVYFNTATGVCVKTDPTTDGYMVGYAVTSPTGIGGLAAGTGDTSADGAAVGHASAGNTTIRFALRQAHFDKDT